MRESIEAMADRGLKAIEKDGLKNDITTGELTQLRDEFIASGSRNKGLVDVITKAFYMGVSVGMSEQKGAYNG